MLVGPCAHESRSVSSLVFVRACLKLPENLNIFGILQMDDVITQAQTTRAALGSQRAMFGDVQGKVKQLSDKFPIVRGLIGSIRRKKSRDTLILSAVIAACTLFLIIYWLSK
ncbi:putative golgi SNAP receptor complex, subunit 1 [Helianthus annuus]|uniref:Golgi SNAP receptor complex, subunit 1 n=1 Tax=Helianthus annuus TaxID=4232 RepID=A0A9K3DUG5_HELAN|nr:putative golgi SNAP receptor complex, subunit 1 [Helianthus annuus]KAJ0822156.1 putative golgi SNAP receptor complex, subunit 1 [Helianthus annuus]